MYVKLTHTGNVLKVAIWVSGTPTQFLLHDCTAIDVCKQMGIYADFAKSKKAVEAVKLDDEIAKMEYVQLCNSIKKMFKDTKGEGTNPKFDAARSTLADAKANL